MTLTEKLNGRIDELGLTEKDRDAVMVILDSLKNGEQKGILDLISLTEKQGYPEEYTLQIITLLRQNEILKIIPKVLLYTMSEEYLPKKFYPITNN